jgi:hypothetical protein
MKTFICLLMGMLISGCALAEPASLKYTVRVLDSETGTPVTNAIVQSFFEHQYDPWGNKPNIIKQEKVLVDENGEAVFSGKDLNGGVGGNAAAEGYYDGRSGRASERKNIALNRWEPWNPTVEVKLRKIKNPVLMVVKRVESLKIPAWDEPLGFDLEKGDWVAPYGKGKQADFFVNVYRRFEHSGDYDAVATITFPNDGDGIQLYTMPEEFRTSSYNFPYIVPVDGYQDKLVLERHATLRETKCSFNPEKDMYIFRVRTKKDKDENIVSACYGRVDRRIEIGWGEVFDFEYHFNPDPFSRSLEYKRENLLEK